MTPFVQRPRLIAPRLLRRIRIVLTAIAVSFAAALAGCVTIPGSGSVEVGLTDLEQAEQFYQFTAPGPATDASQEDVVRGFVAAAVSSTDNYAIAREFLTTNYANQWDPYYGVIVDEGGRTYRSDGDGAGVLSLTANAKVDTAGQMLPVAPGAATDVRFEFERVNGQWRISSAPSGIILDKSTFRAIWTDQQLYFVGSAEVLVPQTRWFIARAALATEIVGALVQGPSERMRESLHTGFPAGATLIGQSVPVVDGRARVDMSAEMLEASPQALAEVHHQLKLSLQTIPGVTGYELLVEGTPLRDDGSGIEPRVTHEISVPAVLMDGELGTISAGEFTPAVAFESRIEELDPLAVSLSPDGARAAVLNKVGVTVLDSAGTVMVDGRADQIAPSIDMFGFLWTATDGGDLQVQAPGGTAVPIAVPWLDALEVAAVRLAPDGTRIAALVASEAGAQVLVGGVVREENGAPLRASADADIEMWVSGEPIDLDWVGPARLSVLSEDGTSTRVTSGGPSRFTEAQGFVPGGQALAGGGGRQQLRVLGSGQELYAPQGGSGWQRNAEGVELLAKRG